MTRNRLTFLAPAPILAATGVGVAAAAVADQGAALAVAVLGGLGLLGTVLLARGQRDARQGLWLRDLMFLGIAARLVVYALIHQSVGPYVFAPDQFTYEGWGRALVVFFFEGGPFPRRLDGSLQVGYPLMNAAVFTVFGTVRAAPAIVNIFLSSWTAVPVFHMALLLVRRHEGVARWAAGLTTFFPSMVLWSVLNIREAPTILVIVLAVYFLVRLQRSVDVAAISGLVVSLAVLTVFREYLTWLVGVAGAAGIVMGRSRSPVRSLLVGSLMLVAVSLAFQTVGIGASLAGEPSLERAQLLREDFQFGAASAYGQQADVSTPLGALRYMPTGLAYFLLAPFPWEVSSALQVITLPEILLWWAVVPFGFWGAFLALRHDARSYTVPLAVLILVTAAYSLVESNVGTAYRHRAQVLPVAFVFCALGLRDAWAVWTARRRWRAERRRRASSSFGGPLAGTAGRRRP